MSATGAGAHSRRTYCPAALSPNAWLRYGLVRDLLRRLPDASSLVEVGCGMGSLASRLADRFDYVGYEPDPQSYLVARQRVGDRGVVINDALPAVETRAFDALVAFEVLEHLEDDRGSLEGWRRWIRPGGHVMLSVPAHPERFGAADVMAGHYRRYRPIDLSTLLQECGFDQVIVWSYGFPLGYLLEHARNYLARSRIAGAYQTRTAKSGRFFQPPDQLGWLTRFGTAPFRVLQRPFRRTSLGTGLVAMARRVP